MTGTLDAAWNYGKTGEPKIQVRAYDESTVILRQSKTVTYEAPFMYLLTGDTVLPGRLYAFDYPAFVSTLDRLVEFAESHPVTHVLGCHVEMRRRPRRDYAIGVTYQPDERAPQMTVDQLRAARDAARAVQGCKGIHRFDDFSIVNEPRRDDLGHRHRRPRRSSVGDRAGRSRGPAAAPTISAGARQPGIPGVPTGRRR